MNRIEIVATFPAIAEDDRDEFTKLVSEIVEASSAEPGTIQYDAYVASDGKSCVFREVYADSDAVLAHMGNVGEMLGTLVDLGGGLEIDMLGTPSDALVEASAPFAPRRCSHLAGV